MRTLTEPVPPAPNLSVQAATRGYQRRLRAALRVGDDQLFYLMAAALDGETHLGAIDLRRDADHPARPLWRTALSTRLATSRATRRAAPDGLGLLELGVDGEVPLLSRLCPRVEGRLTSWGSETVSRSASPPASARSEHQEALHEPVGLVQTLADFGRQHALASSDIGRGLPAATSSEVRLHDADQGAQRLDAHAPAFQTAKKRCSGFSKPAIPSTRRPAPSGPRCSSTRGACAPTASPTSPTQ